MRIDSTIKNRMRNYFCLQFCSLGVPAIGVGTKIRYKQKQCDISVSNVNKKPYGIVKILCFLRLRLFDK
jgi:hypothetical protein